MLADAAYRTLPKLPLRVDWTSIPELLRVAMFDLSGVQPIPKAMSEAAGGKSTTSRAKAKSSCFRKRGTTFQLVSVVPSCVGESDGVPQVRPFAVTLIPASKRGEVDQRTIDLVAELDLSKFLETEPIYSGYEPFSGEWSLYGNLPGYLDGQREGFLDEIGLVGDQFFLATETPDDDEILMMDLPMPSDEIKTKFEKHRKKLLFTPFKKVEARRVWGGPNTYRAVSSPGTGERELFS